MNKKGQIFLIAAVIIISIIIGLVTVTNTVRVGGKNEVFGDLAKEVGGETKQVLNYGVYNSENTNQLIEGFLIEYANYISQDRVLFIYGNETNITGLFFNNTEVGGVGLNYGAVPGIITIRDTTQETAVVGIDEITNEVRVVINDIEYRFKLKKGQNFFFVIIKDDDGESYVAAQ